MNVSLFWDERERVLALWFVVGIYTLSREKRMRMFGGHMSRCANPHSAYLGGGNLVFYVCSLSVPAPNRPFPPQSMKACAGAGVPTCGGRSATATPAAAARGPARGAARGPARRSARGPATATATSRVSDA